MSFCFIFCKIFNKYLNYVRLIVTISYFNNIEGFFFFFLKKLLKKFSKKFILIYNLTHRIITFYLYIID